MSQKQTSKVCDTSSAWLLLCSEPSSDHRYVLKVLREYLKVGEQQSG